KAVLNTEGTEGVKEQALGAVQQYLRNQNMFVFWNWQRDTPEPFFSNSNYAPKNLPIENGVFGELGRGNWTSTVEGVIEGMQWARAPWEVAPPEVRDALGTSRITLPDAVLPGADVRCGSSSDMDF